MSIEALAEKTWKTQRMLLMPVLVIGVLLVVAGFLVGFPLLYAFGLAFLFAGGFGLRRLRAKAAAFSELLADPRRVVTIVPVVQVVSGGIVTHYPVVLVADDGTPYRIATWARSVEEAMAPFLARFPHARGPEGDRFSAPDDNFSDRFKLLGVMFASIFVGLAGALLLTLPSALIHSSELATEYERQVVRNQNEARALEALASAQPTTPWSACTVDSLEPAISVFLEGAKADSYTSRRGGFLDGKLKLSLSTARERHAYRRSFTDVLIDGLDGRRQRVKPLERGLGVVGLRRDDTLVLRLLDLDSGKVLCEGVARVAKTRDGSQYEENDALANAVMQPFCKQLPKWSCREEAPEPVAATPEAAPKTAAPKQVKQVTDPSTPTAPLAAVTPDRAGIQAAMRVISPRARACYERALVKKPTLQGTLTMAFVIGANGQVTGVSGSGFPDTAVTECVTRAFQALRFTRPADGAALPVRYPIVFKPAK